MVEKSVFFNMLLELLDDEEESKDISEDTDLDELEFDSVTKLGVLALLDTYSTKSVQVQKLQTCKKVKDIMDLVDFK